MKKSNFAALYCVILVFLTCLTVFTSCKTVPQAKKVNPLSLLDGNSAFYISIPCSENTELVKRVLQNNVEGLTDKDSEKIVRYIQNIYCGLSHSKNSSQLQAAVECSIPPYFLSHVFNAKTGFVKSQYFPQRSTEPVILYKSFQLDVSMPDSGILCLGRDVSSMIDSYQIISEDEHIVSDDVYNWLNASSTTGEIRFYANSPQSFLSVLTGTKLNLQLSNVYGSLRNDPDLEKQYIMDIEFEFKNEKYAKAGSAMLGFAFGLTDSSSFLENPTHLRISGVKIDKKQLYKLLIL